MCVCTCVFEFIYFSVYVCICGCVFLYIWYVWVCVFV